MRTLPTISIRKKATPTFFQILDFTRLRLTVLMVLTPVE